VGLSILSLSALIFCCALETRTSPLKSMFSPSSLISNCALISEADDCESSEVENSNTGARQRLQLSTA